MNLGEVARLLQTAVRAVRGLPPSVATFRPCRTTDAAVDTLAGSAGVRRGANVAFLGLAAL